MTAATPDATREPHRLELHVLPPELFPDVAAVRRFFASPLYQAILEAGKAIATPETRDATPGPVWDDALTGFLNLLYDLEALGTAVALSSDTPLHAAWKSVTLQLAEEQTRRLRGLLCVLAFDDAGDAVLPFSTLATHVRVGEPYRGPLDFGAREDCDDAG